MKDCLRKSKIESTIAELKFTNLNLNQMAWNDF